MDSTLLPDLESVARGDEHAIKKLFSSEYPRLLGYVRRQGMSPGDAEDVAMDVFVKVILSLRGTASLPELSELKTFRLYMLRMARNALIDHFRRNRAQRYQADEPVLGSPGHADEDWFPPDLSENAAEPASGLFEDHQALTRAFARLEREYPTGADLIRLIAEGATVDEVAAFFGCTTPAARERMSQARKRFRAILEQEGVRQ